MADKGTLTDKGHKIVHKKLKGDNLAEVDKDRRKNGVVDNNDKSQKFYAATDVTIGLGTGNEVWYPGGMQVMSFEVITFPQLLNPLAEVSAVVTVCVPDKLNKFSAEAKKEWKRFYTELLKQEKQHIDDGKKLAQEMLNELAALSATMHTKELNESKMLKEALRLLGKEATKAFSATKIKDRINQVMSKRDSQTGHGSVKLNFDIP